MQMTTRGENLRAVRLGEDDHVVALDLLLYEIHRVHRPVRERGGEEIMDSCGLDETEEQFITE